MSDDKLKSLFNLGQRSKPADTLIKKVTSAVGGIDGFVDYVKEQWKKFLPNPKNNEQANPQTA